MARLVFDGNFDVYYLPAAIANAAAPSLAACLAGTELTGWTPKDGFNPGVTNNRVPGGDLSSTFNDESMGTWSSQLTITLYKDDTNDVAFDTVGVYGATGAIVAVPKGPAQVGTKCYVWPDVEFGQPAPMAPTENAKQKFTIDVACRQAPNFHAVMAA
jgi:hypothetical protein